jgi:glycosyltransferase involved in cell wall biosynthesis
MNIWLVEPYYTGSHQAWADGYQIHSRHNVRLLTLPGRFWKWRMQGGAVTLARQAATLDEHPDLILASDMLNVPIFLALARSANWQFAPLALYFHENQLTYPLQPGEKRNLHYGFINFVSALRADVVLFNSAYHLEEFFDELPRLLKHYPDYTELWAVDALREKSRVLPLGLDLARFDIHRPEAPKHGRPLVLWNHRWEYDKDPRTFFEAVHTLAGEGLDFGLILLGESLRNQPNEFLEARRRWPERIVHFGYAEDLVTYARLLWDSDVVVSTALHDFFGAAVVEACYCGCFPIVPRRLSYPELIPTEQHAACLYDDLSGLLNRLRQAILNVEAVRSFSLQRHMARFDWQRLASHYDDLLERTVQANGSPSPIHSLPHP